MLENKILLVHKVLSGQATGDELLQYEQLKETEKDFQTLVNEIDQVWEHTTLPELPFEVNANEAFNKFEKQKLNLSEAPNNINKSIRPQGVKIFRISNLVKMAAMIVVLFAAITIIKQYNNSFEYYNNDTLISHVLSDHSEVVLNKGAKLIGDTNYDKERREVTLVHGEVFFKISEDKERPFIVHIDDVEVLVTGTAFNIDNDNDKIIVSVQNGSVKVSGNNEVFNLISEDQLYFDKSTKMFSVKKIPSKNVFNWTKNELYFESTALDVVFDDIAKFYQVNIEYPSNTKLCGNYNSPVFKNKPIENVLETVVSIFDLSFKRVDAKHIKILNVQCK